MSMKHGDGDMGYVATHVDMRAQWQERSNTAVSARISDVLSVDTRCSAGQAPIHDAQWLQLRHVLALNRHHPIHLDVHRARVRPRHPSSPTVGCRWRCT